MNEDVLFVFAHQDDEIGCLSRLAFEIASGNRTWCVYMTDGATKVNAAVRDAESLRMMKRLGINAEHVAFLADDQGRIADGQLFQCLERARSILLQWLTSKNISPTRIFVLDWEGGHHDHDASHLVALAVARTLNSCSVFAFSLYNGWRRPSGWFRVISFVPAETPTIRRRISLREALRLASAIFAYPSQRRTWFGLGPGLVIKTLWRRHEQIRLAQAQRVMTRPHEGILLYERLFSVRADDMLKTSATFREQLRQPRHHLSA